MVSYEGENLFHFFVLQTTRGESMLEEMDGYAYLDQLKAQKKKNRVTHTDLSDLLEKKARMQGVPLNGQFELTPLCNLSCKMCYVHLTGQQLRSRPLLTAEQWKSIIHQAWEMGMMSATLTGGECLTYPGFKELYLYLHSLGCEVYVMTNCVLLDEEWVRFFQAHPPAQIMTTLYGCSDGVYERVTGSRAFETVMAHLRLIREAGLPLHITVTPNRYLGEDVFETLRVAKSASTSVLVNSRLFPPREETGRQEQQDDVDAEMYARLLRYQDELNGETDVEIPMDRLPPPGGGNLESKETGLLCGGGRSSFTIDWQGVMTPCNSLEMVRAYPLKDGFREAWRAINQAANAWPRSAVCEGCPYEKICDHCAANLLLFSKDGKRPAALCQRTMCYVQHGIVSMPGCG